MSEINSVDFNELQKSEMELGFEDIPFDALTLLASRVQCLPFQKIVYDGYTGVVDRSIKNTEIVLEEHRDAHRELAARQRRIDAHLQLQSRKITVQN